MGAAATGLTVVGCEMEVVVGETEGFAWCAMLVVVELDVVPSPDFVSVLLEETALALPTEAPALPFVEVPFAPR